MKLKDIVIIIVALAIFFVFGWFAGRNSVKTTEAKSFSGSTILEEPIETIPDTIFAPVSRNSINLSEVKQVVPKIVPIETILLGPERDAAISAALIDWNTKRSYAGTLFDGEEVGAVTYSFDVQFNRAGQISYAFNPAPVLKPKIRLRPTIGGEYYFNGQYSFGGGVQYGALGLNIRALRLNKSVSESSFAFGIGAQIAF